jgi:hypothetical protein
MQSNATVGYSPQTTKRAISAPYLMSPWWHLNLCPQVLEPPPWPAGQSKQEVEPEAGWYLPVGQETHPPGGVGAQSLKPAPFAVPSEWKAKLVVGPGSAMDAGNALV